MAGSLFIGPADAAHHAAAVEREARLEALMEAASEQAKAAVVQLLQLERDFAERRVAAGAELAVIDRSAGDDLLDAALQGNGAAKAKSINTAIAKLRAELETTDSAVEAARAKRKRAIGTVYHARAKALRAEAAPLIAQAAEEEALTIELLDVVEARKGIRPSFERPTSARTLDRAMGAPVAYTILPEQALREEAASLEERAVLQEGQRPKSSGTAEGDNVQELLEQIFSEPMMIGPRVADVQSWAEQTEHRERERRRKVAAAGGTTVDGYIDPAAPVHFRLSWSESKIDDQESRVLATGPTIDETLKARRQDLLIEERAARVDRALAWLEARGGDLRTAVARAEAQGGQEGIAARQYQEILQEAGVGDAGAEAAAEAAAAGEDADLEGTDAADLQPSGLSFDDEAEVG